MTAVDVLMPTFGRPYALTATLTSLKGCTVLRCTADHPRGAVRPAACRDGSSRGAVWRLHQRAPHAILF